MMMMMKKKEKEKEDDDADNLYCPYSEDPTKNIY